MAACRGGRRPRSVKGFPAQPEVNVKGLKPGQAVCFYSQDQDIYMENYVGTYPWITNPGNELVSANTSPC